MYIVAMPNIQPIGSLNKVVVSITSVVVHEELPDLDMNFIDVVEQVEIVLDRIDIEMRLIGMSETNKEVLASVQKRLVYLQDSIKTRIEPLDHNIRQSQ